MLGMLFTDRECREFNYLLRKEMDEMLVELRNKALDKMIKESLINRYRIVFRMYARMAQTKDLSRYATGLKSQN